VVVVEYGGGVKIKGSAQVVVLIAIGQIIWIWQYYACQSLRSGKSSGDLYGSTALGYRDSIDVDGTWSNIKRVPSLGHAAQILRVVSGR